MNIWEMLESFPEVIFQNSVSQKDSFPEGQFPRVFPSEKKTVFLETVINFRNLGTPRNPIYASQIW